MFNANKYAKEFENEVNKAIGDKEAINMFELYECFETLTDEINEKIVSRIDELEERVKTLEEENKQLKDMINNRR